jgi:hypothetical protein
VTWSWLRRRPRSDSHDERAAALGCGRAPALEPGQLERSQQQWLAWYAAQDNVLVPGTGCPLACPCCRHPTLSDRGAEERCRECGWYDDGQDDHDSAVVRGGPNGCLSLDTARLRYVERGGTPLWRPPRRDQA